MIYASPEPICFYKVKAHSGIAGNECADAIAKHSALRMVMTLKQATRLKPSYVNGNRQRKPTTESACRMMSNLGYSLPLLHCYSLPL